MGRQILVLNPNSNKNVTRAIAASVEYFDVEGAPEIVCETLSGAPLEIASRMDIDVIREPILNRYRSMTADAMVIACYADPGLADIRAEEVKPVFGIQESAINSALSMPGKFGVIAVSENAKKRHATYMKKMGVLNRFAKERVATLGVEESMGEPAFAKLLKSGARLRDIDGAETVILGCVGMAPHRERLEAELGIRVIDPVQAAVGMAMVKIF